MKFPRRHFLRLAAGAAVLPAASVAELSNGGLFLATGDTDPRLAAYDSMMMDFMLKYRPALHWR